MVVLLLERVVRHQGRFLLAARAALVASMRRVFRKPTIRQARKSAALGMSLYDMTGTHPATLQALAEIGPEPKARAKAVRKEAPILKACLLALRSHPLVEECWRQQAGQIPVEGGFIRLGNKGKLDIAGRLKAGARYFEIECKAPGRKPEPHQQARIDHLRATGSISGYATSVEEAVAIIERG